jgi:hypothetical protein
VEKFTEDIIMFPHDPVFARDLAKDHERDLLEEVEAEKLAKGEIPADEYPSDDYEPVTDQNDELIPTRRHNKHVHGDR